MSHVETAEERAALFASVRQTPFEELVGSADRLDRVPPQRVGDTRGCIAVHLDRPLAVDAQIVDEIIVSAPTFGDVEGVLEGRISELDMHASMCGISVGDFRRLVWSDAEKIVVAARQLAPVIKRD